MNEEAAAPADDGVFDPKRDRMIITASALGTMFEWYDFFIYGTLAAIIGRTFFPADSEVARFLLVLATFAIGFGVRPIGAALFGYFGDKLGRKYTFLITITLMGLATAGMALVPSAASIGIAAPIILITLRIIQGLAVGGEHSGAAIYVAEHAPVHRRGFYTSFIQGGSVCGFLLSLLVVLGTQYVVGEEAWLDWAWRLPFAFSLALLAISLWMRMKLSESPVFKSMQAAGEVAKNPLFETFTFPGNKKRLIVVLFGVSAGLSVIWYTVTFQLLYLLQNSLRVEVTHAQLIVSAGAVFALGWNLFFGWLSDRVGRRKPLLIGYAASLVLLLPAFHLIGDAANPGLAAAAARAPVVVAGPDCNYDPFAKAQDTECGRLLDYLSKKGVAYSMEAASTTSLSVADRVLSDISPATLDRELASTGYDLSPVKLGSEGIATMLLGVFLLSVLWGSTYGTAAALMCEIFPARIRYSSMSISYHIGAGYFGGFLPFISQLIVAETGDPYAGLWYTLAVVALALGVCLWGLPETRGAPLGRDEERKPAHAGMQA